jgi:hypothetical protein
MRGFVDVVVVVIVIVVVGLIVSVSALLLFDFCEHQSLAHSSGSRADGSEQQSCLELQHNS